MLQGAYVVVDIGKTLSKVTLWSPEGRVLDRQTRSNDKCASDGIRRLDVNGIATWLVDALSKYREESVCAIIPVGHGAGVAAIADDMLAFAPLDYEQPIPSEVMSAYRAERDAFAATGSPALPDGLNLGSQLFWLEQLYPEAMRKAVFVPWAQYWTWFLTGTAVSEATSLGCHTDLWAPETASFSPMAQRLGWAERFGPLAKAGDVVGALRPQLAAQTGLSPDTVVLAGLHDSNAALLAARGFPEIADNEATVFSTGTWFIAMRLAAGHVPIAQLSEARDTLINVDAYGSPIASARFMGGREIESVIEIDTRRVDIKPDQPALLAAVPDLIARGTMLLPTLAPGCGPFPGGRGTWLDLPLDWDENWHARRAAVCLYAALVADTALDLIGSKARLLVEGRFAEAEVFVRALAALRPDTQVFVANAHNDVSFGALRLINPQLMPQGGLVQVAPLEGDLADYRRRWTAALGVPA